MNWVIQNVSRPERQRSLFNCLMRRGQNWRANVTLSNGDREVTISVRIMDRSITTESEDGLAESVNAVSEVFLKSQAKAFQQVTPGHVFSRKSLLKRLKMTGLNTQDAHAAIRELSIQNLPTRPSQLASLPSFDEQNNEIHKEEALLKEPSDVAAQPEAGTRVPSPNSLEGRKITQLSTSDVNSSEDASLSSGSVSEGSQRNPSPRCIDTYYRVDQLFRAQRITPANHSMGRGGFGRAYEAFYRGKRLVIKELDKPEILRKKTHEGEKLSFELQTALKVYGVVIQVPAKRITEEGSEIFENVFAYITTQKELEFLRRATPGASLTHVVTEHGGVSMEEFGIQATRRQLRKVFRDVLEELRTLHANGIVHKDLKPENIVRNTETGRSKLIDFGLSEKLDRRGQVYRSSGTRGFAAPETLEGGVQSKQVDMWGFGATAIKLLLAPLIIWEKGFMEKYKQFLDGVIYAGKGYQDDAIRCREIVKFLVTNLHRMSNPGIPLRQYIQSLKPVDEEMINIIVLSLAWNPQVRMSSDEGFRRLDTALQQHTSTKAQQAHNFEKAV